MTVRWLLAIGLVVVSGAMPGTAWAYWNSEGTGTGTATVATLPLPVVTGASPPYSDQVDISWTAPNVPAGMQISGYRVVRVAGGTPTPACGTTPSSPLPAAALSCVDTGLADGEADYVVTAVVGTWTTTGTTPVPVTVDADRTAPTIRLSGAQRSNALIDRRDGQSLLFFRPAAGGSIRIDAELTDEEVGPASATFPAVSAPGWSHASETVTSGTGSAPTVTYRSTALAFEPGAAAPAPMEITGADARGNSRTRELTFVVDAAAPAGGALTVNGVVADASGPQSWDTDGTFTVSAITPFVEEQSASAAGLADVDLVRESAALASGSCGAFGGASDIGLTSPVEEASLPDGCYRYTLSGTDRVGNSAQISTTVRVDTTAPVGGALEANSVGAVPTGSTSITSSGSWSVTRTDFADPGSGLVSSALTRAQGALTAGACTSFGAPGTVSGSPGEASAATGCYRYVLTGVNAAGLTSELSTTVWVDRAAPTGGGLTVNGVGATGAGSSSASSSSSVTLSVLTGFTDANAGIDTNAITRTFAPMAAGVCLGFDPATEAVVSGTAPFTVTGLADGCHRFTLTGTDVAGNSASISTTVRLDASAPVAGEITVNGVAGSPSGVMAYARTNPQAVEWTKFSDPESGMTTALVRRTTSSSLSNGVCSATYGSPSSLSTTLTPLSGTASQSLTSGRCYKYAVTGTNAFGQVSAAEVVLMLDTSAPSGSGSLTVNNTTATSSNSATGTFSITTLRTFADTQSGISAVTLDRTWAPLVNGVCGTYEPATTVPLPLTLPVGQTGLPVGCYRFVQTGMNAVGGSAFVATVVRVDSTAPEGGSLTANGVAATTGPGSTSLNVTGAWTIDRVVFADPESTETNTFTRAVATALNGGNCGPFGTAADATGRTTESGVVTGCVRYIVASTNSLGLTTTLTTIVKVDRSAPVGGALTVNGVSASAAGTSSISATGTFLISTRSDFTDSHSGMSVTSLTRAYGPACADVDPASAEEITGSAPIAEDSLPTGCYRYVLTGTNGAGGTSTIATSVTVGP